LIPEIDGTLAPPCLMGHPALLAQETLNASVDLLRSHHPALALSVRNILMTPNATIPCAILDASTVGKIVAALTELGKSALKNRDAEKKVILRGLIEDWASAAEWLIKQSENNALAGGNEG